MMNQSPLRAAARLVASLKLTVALLVAAMVLVYAGTWAQIDNDIWRVQSQYFYSFYTWIDFRTLLPRPRGGVGGVPGGFPFPGGYTVGLLMVINLLAAHASRFIWSWKRSGIILIHLGLLILLAGQLITSLLAVESQMMIRQGQTAQYSEDTRVVELAVIDPADPATDKVTVIPQERLRGGALIDSPQLPWRVRIEQFFPDSRILGPMQAGPQADPRATQGAGQKLTVVPSTASGVGPMTQAMPSAYITLARDGKPLGTWLVSLFFDGPQEVGTGPQRRLIELRHKRLYKPYSVELLKFSHDRYPGTDIPRNFSSLVRLVDPRHHVDRQELIWMNHPLYYRGETFYQASFSGEDTTVLQVVSNPGKWIPYIACAIGGFGMALHFLLHLIGFLRKRNAPTSTTAATSTAAPTHRAGAVAWTAALLSVVFVATSYWMGRLPSNPVDLGLLGQVPILLDGRAQPLDSAARNAVRVLSGRGQVRVDGRARPAVAMLADMIASGGEAQKVPVIRIDQPEVVAALNLPTGEKLFSFEQFVQRAAVVNQQLQNAQTQEPTQRDLFARKMLELGRKLELYQRLGDPAKLFLTPPSLAEGKWQTLQSAIDIETAPGANPSALAGLLSAMFDWHGGQAASFNDNISRYVDWLSRHEPGLMTRMRMEMRFNQLQPFYLCMILYVLAFILIALSWLVWQRSLRSAAIGVLWAGFCLHTLALALRMWLQGRPPVTNLYSSAIFIPWGAMGLTLLMERIYRNGLGAAAAAIMGFVSLLIAHNLALDIGQSASGNGDTLGALQAVLDTNLWLATHVVTVTLGYSAAFLAGGLGIFYVLRNLLIGRDADANRELSRMIYAVVCFAALLSFVGTILGGIWADQSWGRFWGWDPKENGAVLIVLWTALILHARWAGLAHQRGVALLAIGGNIVTAWSWFGTNMLGVGLHSYGFMDRALAWLLAFVASQIFLIGLGLLPAGQASSTSPPSSGDLQ